MEGMTHEQMLCATLALLICLVSCALLPFAQPGFETGLCCIAAALGVVAFWLSIK